MSLRLALVVLVTATALPAVASAADPINAIVGDASWPDAPASATEVARIETHLAFVERLLRPESPDLSRDQRAKRRAALDALARYREAGVFPRRTADAYRGRRPRFIDDRGVHCAVGEMIRATGHAELARRIDARFEYAYVEQFDDPGLARWAKRYGFSVKELAMIQPGYDPVPDDAFIEHRVRDATERFTLECARRHEPADSFRLRVRYRPHSDVRFRSIRWFDDFVQCFLAKARESIRIGSGAYDEEPHRVRTRMRVEVESPQAILERRLDAIDLDADSTPCFPRPGAVPERVSVRVRVDGEGLRVEAATAPSNAAVGECLEGHVRERLAEAFGPGRWRLDARVERAVGPRASSERVQRLLESYAANFATECWNEGEPDHVEVTASGERDAEALAIEVEGGSEAFAACLEPKLRERLRQTLTVHVLQPDGTRAPYFRIDGDADGSVAIDVETPAEREARIERQEEMERQMEREQRYL